MGISANIKKGLEVKAISCNEMEACGVWCRSYHPRWNNQQRVCRWLGKQEKAPVTSTEISHSNGREDGLAIAKHLVPERR
ncbi:hypothetical protein PoB_007148900 [Plakobranchus ocellatus]|uniref:Apple domain-containing protein n=1 Tax=Plakobranchus ocellatus TaxID=259542 RepID=A0AAV4DLQ7_9GAST|nr:hypothetical protein PoB_007148900 [Plakobranchus ocellatus]